MPRFPFGDVGFDVVIFDYGTASGQANLDISPCLGAVSLKATDSLAPVHQEDQGDTPVDQVIKGTVYDFEVPMVRSTLAQLHAVMPGTTLVGNVLTFGNMVGEDLYADSVPVCLKPKKKGVVSTDHKTWLLIYKCAPYKSFDLKFDRSSQRVILVKFCVFPNLDSGFTGQPFQFGVV